MYNKVILVGRLTRDPELRYLPSGTALVKFGIATSRTWTDKNTSEKKEEVMFIDITSFGRSAEIVNQYLKKGNKVLIDGRLTLEQWVDQNGNKRSRHIVTAEAVHFMESKAEAQRNSGAHSGDYGNYQASPASQQPSYNQQKAGSYAPQQSQPQEEKIPEINLDDDEIPF